MTSCNYKGYTINKPYTKLYYAKRTRYANKERITEYTAHSFICLDTETSHNHNNDNPQCWIYQWAFTFNGGLYYGRKPSELIDKLNEIISEYQLDDLHKIIIFVHNLPYDFSYLCLYLYEAFGDPVNVLATEAHKPFVITYNCGLEFRCSYKLSNDSLLRFGQKLGCKYIKLDGAIDYNIIRSQDTPLYRDDWRYMFTDCIAMDEAINKQMALYNDNILTLPFTSTGYPRRELFRAFNGKGHHGNKRNYEREKFKDTRLEQSSYLAYYDEFSGGITHGNRHYKGETLRGKIRHRDFRSHYPTQQQKFMPMGKPVKFTDKTNVEYLRKFAHKNAILCHVVLEDMRIKSKSITLPYLQSSHVRRRHTDNFRLLDDNGRVIQFKGQTSLWLDFHELELILSQYTYTYMAILETYICKLGKLPPWMINTINDHFKSKSDLSKALRVAEKNGTDKATLLDMRLNLMKDKNLLNGIYGVGATNPVRAETKLYGDIWETTPPSKDSIQSSLDNYYGSLKKCMRYQWGVYTTILARLQLMEVYNIIGAENFIYADTDSMFYFSTPDIEAKLNKYNEDCRQWALDNGAYITTSDGDIINYNAFTDEGEDIIAFRFLHSKCYAYVTADNKLHCTIAGVKAYDRETKTYREDELGNIDNLKHNFVFTKCGGTSAKYIQTGELLTTESGNEWAGGCIISRVTKTLRAEEWSEAEDAYLVHYDN